MYLMEEVLLGKKEETMVDMRMTQQDSENKAIRLVNITYIDVYNLSHF